MELKHVMIFLSGGIMYLQLIILSLAFYGCSTSSKVQDHKIVLERSSGKNEMPEWTTAAKQSWKKKDLLYIKGQYTVRGNQRVSACYDLAKSEAKENLITEMTSNFRNEINGYTQGLNEEENQELNKMFISEVNGKVVGLRLGETAYERSLINNVERINCYVLFEISESSYNETLRNSKKGISAVNKEIIEKLKDRGVDFMSGIQQTE